MKLFLEKIRYYSAHIVITLICINDSIFINTWIAPGPIINIKYVLVFYFSFFEKDRLSVTFLFILGLIFDSLQGMPFGLTPICFIALNKLAIFLKKRRTYTNFQNEFIAFATSLLVTQIISVIILNYFSQNPFEYFLLAINIIITLIFYPVIRQILKIFYFN
jgi:cell shape-determining protein MreD